jgi:hypothetical protein
MWATVSELLKFKKSGGCLVLVRPLPQLHNNGLSFADVVRRLTSVQGTAMAVFRENSSRIFFLLLTFFRCKSKNKFPPPPM